MNSSPKHTDEEIKKTMDEIIEDKLEDLTRIRAEQAEFDRKAQIRYAKKEENLKIAKNFKNKGISLEIISEATGIPLSKVKEL
jgi:hypothetical protein